MSRATVTIDGYLSKDPELRRTQQGKAVLQLSVPHQRSKRNQDGSYENQGETTWWQATLWEDQAEQYAPLLKKGTHVLITGVPEISGYQKQDGTTGIRSEVLFPAVGVIPRAQQRQQQAPAESWGQQPQGGGQSAGWGQPQGQPQQQPWSPQQQTGGAQSQDVWSTPGGQSSYDDETPF